MWKWFMWREGTSWFVGTSLEIISVWVSWVALSIWWQRCNRLCLPASGKFRTAGNPRPNKERPCQKYWTQYCYPELSWAAEAFAWFLKLILKSSHWWCGDVFELLPRGLLAVGRGALRTRSWLVANRTTLEHGLYGGKFVLIYCSQKLKIGKCHVKWKN